jgi:hypothetical protein
VPCIIRNAIPSPATLPEAMSASSNDTLSLTVDEIVDLTGENVNLTVDVTPDGHGDVVRTVLCEEISPDADGSNKSTLIAKKMFVKPHEQEMSLAEFRSLLRSEHLDSEQDANLDDNGLSIYPTTEASSTHNKIHCSRAHNPVVHYSRQNDCLRTEMSSLFSTGIFPTTFAFAEEAFGTGPPDAVNLWIGNERSASSMHKDHYENLFYVCSGQKEFILSPPADVVFLHEGEFPSATFSPCYKDNSQSLAGASWTVVPDHDLDNDGNAANTKWIEPDVKRCIEGKYSNDKFPLLSKSHSIKVLVSQGEMLYIPSLWFHRVSQTVETVGVNYWFDMKFDSAHWCYFNFLQHLKRQKSS